MEITNILDKLNFLKQQKVEENGAEEKKTERKDSQGKEKDNVNLSSQAQELNLARKAVQESSDVREEKIAALKDQINSGEYKVDARQTAQNMLKEDLEFWF